jgi:hypothetical protein
MVKKSLVVAAATAALTVGTVGAAFADNTAVQIEKNAARSATHKIMNVKALVVCSPDTTSAFVSAQVSQTNPAGDTQTAYGAVANLNSIECTGEEQDVTIPIRIPTGGFNWRAGEAAVRHVVFKTTDPSGTYFAFLKARTVKVS